MTRSTWLRQWLTIPRTDWIAALFIAPAAGFLICAYELVRTPSMTLFQAAYGPEKLSLLLTLLPIVLLAAIFLYGLALSRLGPRRTLRASTLVFAAFIVLEYFLTLRNIRIATAFLYLFREAFGLLIIEQYWSFINSSISESGAKKLNGPISVLTGLGGMIGGLLVARIAHNLGTHAVLLACAASLIPATILADLAYRFRGEPKEPPRLAKALSPGHYVGLHEFKASPVLLLLFFVVMATQALSTVLDLNFQIQVHQFIQGLNQQTEFMGGFFAKLNLVAMGFQLVGCPLLLTFMSARIIQVLIPLVHITTAFILLMSPSLGTAAWSFLLFKSIDYSLFRVTKEILYIPLSFDARYRAKEMIDIFSYRFGKSLTSMLVYALQRLAIMAQSLYSAMALASAILWLVLAVPLIQGWKLSREAQLTTSTSK